MQSKIYRSFISRSKDEIHLLQHAHKCLSLHSQRNNYLKIYPIQLIVQHSTLRTSFSLYSFQFLLLCIPIIPPVNEKYRKET
ncbi:hypothetical protein FHEFKHOI_00963 [Candidatus Methanoperedenaceae archaeon GB50]|nr:hypothetical protein FHEFKHOI_00963 [Candidatus Methanoperedenaceae archaeon GB50]CAD7778292.1 MAG: hypothetical protein KBONHNOK_01121 [Candidatus Methanoperedenaceae archaeon GB50]